MRYVIIIIALPLLAFSQDFEFEMEYESIPLEVEGYEVPVPWTGGYSNSCLDFCDIDGDGDKDLFVGHFSNKIVYYQNNGTLTDPSFSLMDEQFAGIDNGEGVETQPIFWDMDSDGDQDLFLGNANEVFITVYENIGSPSAYAFEMVAESLHTAFGEPIPCTRPALWDVDLDGDKDLFCGEHTGAIWFYENIGDSSQYSYEFITDAFAGIDVGTKSSPCFVDIDSDDDYDLFIGNANGNVWFYQNDGTPEIYNFADPVINWLGIDVGDNASPEFCDIDGDGDYDLFLGKSNSATTPTPRGAMHYWKNIGSPTNPDFIEISQSYLTFDAGWTSSADLSDIDQDSDMDLFFITNDFLGWMENIGSATSPSFILQTYDLIGSLPPSNCDLADINNDGAPDLVVVDCWNRTLDFYLNQNLPGQLQFMESGSINTGYILSEVTFADMDADGDQDILVGGWEDYPSGIVLIYYENDGTPEIPHFTFITDNYQNIPTEYSMSLGEILPCAADVDLDGDFDLLLMHNFINVEIWYFENVGTPQQALLDSVTNNFLGFDLISSIYADVVDIDSDGYVDVFGGRTEGGISFLRNITGQNEVGPRRPYVPYPKLDFSIGPNPANPVTWISFALPAPQEATLAVYNILGAKVTTIASGLQMPGTHNVIWNASQYSSGLYIIRLETPQSTASQRVMVVK